MEPDKRKVGVWLRRAHKGFGERSFPSRTKYATPPAGRTAPATVYKCALVNKGLMACPRILAGLQSISAAPGRWDRAIRNALTSAPERSEPAGKSPPKWLRAQSGGGCEPCVLRSAACSPKSSCGFQAAGSPSGLPPVLLLGLGCNFFVHVRHLFSLKTLID